MTEPTERPARSRRGTPPAAQTEPADTTPETGADVPEVPEDVVTTTDEVLEEILDEAEEAAEEADLLDELDAAGVTVLDAVEVVGVTEDGTVVDAVEVVAVTDEGTVVDVVEVVGVAEDGTVIDVVDTVEITDDGETVDVAESVEVAVDGETVEVVVTEAEAVPADAAVEVEVVDVVVGDDGPIVEVVDVVDVPAEASGAPTPAAAARPGAPRPPAPTPRPTPRPPSVAPAPRPSAGAPPRPAAVKPASPSAHDAYEAAQAAQWGRVDEDGTVWVRESTGERSVGQYPGADSSEALAFYVRRYLDLQAQVALLEARLPQLAPKEVEQTVTSLEEQLVAPAAVGDLDGLRARLAAVSVQAAERRAQVAAEREAARAEAVAARTAIVETAERIAATDPSRMQWKQAGDELRVLLDDWKTAQRHGPRLDKASEDALWKRFSHARSTFDRGRRQYFADLEQHRNAARAAKEAIVAEAERLAESTDWSATATAYRTLMERWKAAGRAAQRDDDQLWDRFRAAQDRFFSARQAASSTADAELVANLEAKLALAAEAETILPVTDVAQARAALRSIQERWDAAGRVPRADVQRVEARLRAVEQAVRDAQQAQWARSNPETRARAEGAAAQLEASIAALEADLDEARKRKDRSAIREAETALATRRSWLAQVRKTASEG